MAAPPPPWIILSTTPRVSDKFLPGGRALSLKVEAPPRVSFLTVAPGVCPDDRRPGIVAVDASGLLVVCCTERGVARPTYCVLNMPAAALSYRLPEDPVTGFDAYIKPGVTADPDGAAGAFVLADPHVTCSSSGEYDTLVRYRSRTRWWEWWGAVLEDVDGDEDAVPDIYWNFDDVISHGGSIWWIDTNAGLLTVNPFRNDNPPFCYIPLPDVEDRTRRYVQLSDGKLRCVQIRKPKDHSHGADADAAPTFIAMRTLIDPERARWTGPEYELSFADIRAADTFKAAGLPEDKDPFFTLIHPKNPEVLYFFLDDYLFAFDMRARKLIECEAHGLGINISPDSVRAWELPLDYAAAIASPAPAPARAWELLPDYFAAPAPAEGSMKKKS